MFKRDNIGNFKLTIKGELACEKGEEEKQEIEKAKNAAGDLNELLS